MTTTPLTQIIQAKIGKIDLVMLLTIWLLTLIASIKSLGYFGAGIFVAVSILLVIKRPDNGILILLLLFYTPASALMIPNIYMVSFVIVLFGYLLHGNFFGILTLAGTNFFLLALMFSAWSLATTLFAHDFQIAFGYWMQYCHGILMLIVLILGLKKPESCGRVLKWWAIVAALTLFISAIHYYLGDDTFLYSMLKNVRKAGGHTAVTSMTIGIGYNEVTGRLIWPGIGPNYHSANLIFPFGIALAFYDSKNFLSKLFWLIVCILTASAVVGTFSRSGFISIGLVTALYLVQRSVRAIVPIMVMGSVLTLLVLLLPQLILRIGSIGDAVATGATGRFTAWGYAVDMWFSSPVYGTGLGSYFAAHGGVAHNTYLSILSETGLIGVLLYLSVIFYSVKMCLKTPKAYSSISSRETLFLRTLVMALGGMCLMIATISYEEVKLFWMACSICGCIYLVAGRQNQSIRDYNESTIYLQA